MQTLGAEEMVAMLNGLLDGDLVEPRCQIIQRVAECFPDLFAAHGSLIGKVCVTALGTGWIQNTHFARLTLFICSCLCDQVLQAACENGRGKQAEEEAIQKVL